MATLLQFDPARRLSAPRGGALEGTAKILFFTGIRYERPDDKADGKAENRKPRKAAARRTDKTMVTKAKR